MKTVTMQQSKRTAIALIALPKARPGIQLLSAEHTQVRVDPRFRYRLEQTAAVMPKRMRRLRLRTVAACLLSALGVSACATFEPSAVSADVEHISHASQHIGPVRTDYGYNAALVTVHWQPSTRIAVSLAEGASLDGCHPASWINPNVTAETCGSFTGPREVFEGKVSVTLWAR